MNGKHMDKLTGPGKAVLGRLLIALIMAICLILTYSVPVAALSLSDYFTWSYDIELSKDTVQKDETFHATVTAQATCINDLPLPISEGFVTGRILAEHVDSGTKVTLISSYTVTITDFPAKEGDNVEKSLTVSLDFPAESPAGAYDVFGEIIEARIKVVLWFTVTSQLPQSASIGPVTYLPEGTGEPITGDSILPETTDTSDKIDAQGKVIETFTIRSVDNEWALTLNKDTLALDDSGRPVTAITMLEMAEPPAPSADYSVISLIYDLGPDGASFDRLITLTVTYDELQLPEGVSEDDLVIAIWDKALEEWVELEDCVVDSVGNTVTVAISHFTAFAVLAHTAVSPAFSTSDLTILPSEVSVGGSVSISVLVTNSGDLPGGYEVSLEIDGEVEETREMTLAGGVSELVTFLVTRDVAASYQVEVDGQRGQFTVEPVLVAPPSEPFPWWGIVIGVIGVVVVGLLVYFLIIRPRRA